MKALYFVFISRFFFFLFFFFFFLRKVLVFLPCACFFIYFFFSVFVNFQFSFVLPCSITKTCLYNFDPLQPHLYIVKLGFTGVYIIFHISAQNIDCGYSLEPPRRGGSNEYPLSMF